MSSVMCDSIGVLGQQAPAAAISDFEKVSPTNLQYNADGNLLFIGVIHV